MTTLAQFLLQATAERWATGHFNASEADHMRSIIAAAKNVFSPAIVGTSEGERKHLGAGEAVALRDAFRKEYGIPVFLNADHSKSVETARAAVDAGYDSIHIDLSAEPYDENAAGTRAIVEYARAKDSGISVEGELGYLRGESKIQKEKITVRPEDYTKPEEAERFVAATGVDRLAIAVGNVHGIAPGEPDLDIERIREIRRRVPEGVALVLHAASGIPDGQIRAAIEAGIANIHINTDLRVAYVDALRASLRDLVDEVATYKLDAAALEAMQRVVEEKLKLFGAHNRL